MLVELTSARRETDSEVLNYSGNRGSYSPHLYKSLYHYQTTPFGCYGLITITAGKPNKIGHRRKSHLIAEISAITAVAGTRIFYARLVVFYWMLWQNCLNIKQLLID